MSEYVCELPLDDMVSFVSGSVRIPVLERITRCKDCMHFKDVYLINDIGGPYLWCSLSANEMKPSDFCSLAEPIGEACDADGAR